MLLFVLLAVFIAADDRSHAGVSGKIDARNENDRAGVILVTPMLVLLPGAGDDDGCRTQRNAEPRPHGFSEVLYAAPLPPTITVAFLRV